MSSTIKLFQLLLSQSFKLDALASESRFICKWSPLLPLFTIATASGKLLLYSSGLDSDIAKLASPASGLCQRLRGEHVPIFDDGQNYCLQLSTSSLVDENDIPHSSNLQRQNCQVKPLDAQTLFNSTEARDELWAKEKQRSTLLSSFL